MSLAAIRDEIKTILEGVTGIGKVYDYQRISVPPTQLPAIFESGGTLNAWMITRSRTPGERLTNLETLRRYRFVIMGFYEHNDPNATEITFQDLVETIEAAFRANHTLNGTAEIAGPLQVEEVALREFNGGAILAHFCRLELDAQERLAS